ncbi:MAG TPA: 3'-5' exonuclease [Gemmatimonadaceae bacterium]|nr:3'-5' exonuclease [Gemmatimonadaceae bacterium]
MELNQGGIDTRAESTLLATRAAQFLEKGPADPVSLIGYVCNLPGAPKIVAEHMAEAIFAGRPEFSRDEVGRWLLTAANLPMVTADLLENLSYVVVDLETTGNQHYAGDRIMEVAAVRVKGGKIVDVFETLVNPERPIPQFVSRLTRITWSMVKDAPRFVDIEPRLLEVISGHVFVAHNSNFDWRFLAAEVRRASGRELVGRRLCTVRLARQLLPQLPRRSLDYVARYYGVEIKHRHRAGGDAVATAHCLIRLIDDAADRGYLSWSDLYLLGSRGSGRRKKRRRSAMPRSVDKDDTI